MISTFFVPWLLQYWNRVASLIAVLRILLKGRAKENQRKQLVWIKHFFSCLLGVRYEFAFYFIIVNIYKKKVLHAKKERICSIYNRWYFRYAVLDETNNQQFGGRT